MGFLNGIGAAIKHFVARAAYKTEQWSKALKLRMEPEFDNLRAEEERLRKELNG